MKKPRRQTELPYREGSWFTLPLRGGGYAAGRVARLTGRGVAFGYFFGPRRETPPSLDDLRDCLPENAVLRAKFGDLYLLDGRWSLLQDADFERDGWTVPPLAGR